MLPHTGPNSNSGNAPSAFVVPKYTIVDLGATVVPAAINNQGTVVGSSASGAFAYRNGAMQPLSAPAGDSSFTRALDVNNEDVIVGYSVSTSGTRRALLWNGSSVTDLGGLQGSTGNEATAINDQGEIVGHSTMGFGADVCNGPAVQFDGHGGATTFSDSNLQNAVPNAVNNNGVFAGGYCVPSAGYDASVAFVNPPFQRLAGPGIDPDDCGRPNYQANDGNNSGSVVGIYQQGDRYNNCGEYHGFVYNAGTYVDVPPVDQDTYSNALAINDDGVVVGESGPHALLYADGKSYDLNKQLTGAGCELWTLASAADINKNGEIVGRGYIGGTNGVEHGFLLVPASSP